jgi:hypothetical protein
MSAGPAAALGEDQRVSKRFGRQEEHQSSSAPAGAACDPSPRSPVAPFVMGTVIGGLAGAIVGTAVSPYTRGMIVGLYHLVSRRLSSSERDQLRFELLLQ